MPFFLFAVVIFTLPFSAFSQLRVKSHETVCYGLKTTLLRFSVPAGYFADRENPYVSITPITQSPARVFQSQVTYGSRYPRHWYCRRDSAAVERDNLNRRESYVLVIDEVLDAGKYRILYTFDDGKTRHIDSTILTVVYAGLGRNMSKEAYFGQSISITDWAMNKRIRSYYPDASRLDSNIRFGFASKGAGRQWYAFDKEHSSPLLSQYATSASIQAVWRYAETGEELPVLSQLFRLEQRVPTLHAKNVIVHNTQPSLFAETPQQAPKARVCFDVAGLEANVSDIPVGVQTNDSTKALFADSTCLRWGQHEIMFEQSVLRVFITNNGKTIADTNWNASPATVRLVAAKPYGTNALLSIECSELPVPRKGEQVLVRGTLALRSSAFLRNPFNGVASKTVFTTFDAPITLELPNNLTVLSPVAAARLGNGSANTPLQMSSPSPTKITPNNTTEPLPPRTPPQMHSTDVAIVDVNDWSLVKRFSEEYTPLPQRTAALEMAEQYCENTVLIRSAISNHQPLERQWITQAERPNDCETVAQYYSALTALRRIAKLYAVCRIANGQPDSLLALFATHAPSKADALSPQWLQTNLAAPLRIFSPDDLRQIPTQVFVNDDSTGTKTEVRGSMMLLDSSLKTIAQYIHRILPNTIANSAQFLVGTALRGAKREITGVRVTKEFSTETLGEEVVMIAADSLLVRRFAEVFTPGLPRTPALERAEAECDITTNIVSRIRLRQPIPNDWIDKSTSPADCETVKNFYTALESLQRIKSVYILLDKNMLKRGRISVLGTIAYENKNTFSDSKFPQLSLDIEDLRHFKTKEMEKDDSSGALVSVKGSMDSAPYEYCAEYCQYYAEQMFKQGTPPTALTAFAVRNNGRGSIRRVIKIQPFRTK